MAGPDRFRNLQTDLFCIKRDFIGPKKMYILVTFVIKFVETITVVSFFAWSVQTFTRFDSIPCDYSRVKPLIAQLSNSLSKQCQQISESHWLVTKLPVAFRNIVSHEKQLPDWLKLTIVRAGLIGDANTDQSDFCSFYSFFLNLIFSFDRQRHGPKT